jgi:hypothetical protein
MSDEAAITVLVHSYAGLLDGGDVDDTFEKVGGTWRFTDRLITGDLGGQPSPEAPR